jgi:hypothetical protein
LTENLKRGKACSKTVPENLSDDQERRNQPRFFRCLNFYQNIIKILTTNHHLTWDLGLTVRSGENLYHRHQKKLLSPRYE